jgi:NADP-dependent 3-hydroxy acid dehydrogenase YdfG
MPQLTNQVALVTGAGSGIGKAVAQALASEGAAICLVGRTKAKLEATEASLRGGAAHVVLPTDLSHDDQMDALTVEVERRCGRVDVLVLSAGEIAHGSVQEAPVATFDTLYRANVRANYRLVQRLLPSLKKGPGQIAVINSSVGLSSRPNVGQFSATQHALKAVTDALRGEVNGEGIRVLSVYPGRTATPRQAALYRKDGKDYHPEVLLQPEDIAAVVVNALLLPRTAEVTDISIRPMMKSY